MEPFQRSITAAQGYYELQMLEEAIGELDELPLNAQLRADVLEMRVTILMKTRRWGDAIDACEKLCAVAPDAALGFIHLAYCLHESGRTQQAKDVLLEGPSSLSRDPTYYYNMACYECVLGNVETARVYLETSLSIDSKLSAFAKVDPDLKALNCS